MEDVLSNSEMYFSTVIVSIDEINFRYIRDNFSTVIILMTSISGSPSLLAESQSFNELSISQETQEGDFILDLTNE